jgi:hypothetical protein
MQDIESQLDEPVLDFPLQHRVVDYRLQRMQLELYLYSKAIAQAATFRAAHPERKRSEIP